jgi:hypothetical protein
MSGVFKPFDLFIYNLTRQFLSATTVPKCDGLVLTNYSNTARKNKSVNSFVSKPVHEGDLRLKWKTGLPDLRIAMELNETQFQKIIVSAVSESQAQFI